MPSAAMVMGGRAERRGDRILRAVQEALAEHKNAMNADPYLRAIRIEVRRVAGTDDVRTVVIALESERILR